MDIKQRISFLKKIAQSAVASKVNPGAAGLGDYANKLSSIIPGLKTNLLTPNDWIYLGRIIGVIDQSIYILSGKTMNFYTVSTTAPSASASGSSQLMILISAAKMLKEKLIASRTPYTPQQKITDLCDPLRRDIAARLSNAGSPELINKINSSPPDALRREITAWQTTIIQK